MRIVRRELQLQPDCVRLVRERLSLMTKQYKVNFNEGHLRLFNNLQKHKLTSMTFADFVRTAFSEKVDKTRFGGLSK